MRAVTWAAALWVALAWDAAAGPMTAEAMWGLTRLSAPALSPDGAAAVVRATHYDAQTDARTVDLWLLPTRGGPARQLTHDPGAENDPAWSPRGDALALIAQRGDDTAPQIYLMTDKAPPRRVTAVATGVEALRWLPGGEGFVFVSRVWEDLGDMTAQARRLAERADRRVSARSWTKPPVAQWDQYTDDRVGHLFATDLAGEVRPLTLGRGPAIFVPALEPPAFDIAPDGAEIAYAADSDTSGVRPNLDIYTLDLGKLATGRAVNLTADNPQDDDLPLYSPDGLSLAFVRQRVRGFYADRKALLLRQRDTGAVREIAPTWDRSAEGLVWAPDSSALYGAIDDAGERSVYRLPVAAGPPERLTAGADFRALAIAGPASRPTLVALRESFSEPATLVRLAPGRGTAVKLSAFNDNALKEMRFGRVESVTYRGAEGAPVQMWVVKPPGFDSTKAYPLFLLLHGGPHNAITNAWTYRWNAHVFAGWGYVVAWPNFHGSSGFGQAFADAINPNRADLPYKDVIAAADWFKAKPWIDPQRMVAGGGSYGGYLATVVLGRPHPFKALVAHAPVYNTFTQIGSDYGGEQDRFAEPWDAPAEALRYSPHTSAARFVTPMLVTHGQLDQRVPVNHSVELFHTLQRRGVASKLLLFPNEGHWVLGRSNALFWYETVRTWLAAYAPPGATGVDAPEGERVSVAP
jgi:dipeptidyl aminopeptidase/acylaminoacyl peptidase